MPLGDGGHTPHLFPEQLDANLMEDVPHICSENNCTFEGRHNRYQVNVLFHYLWNTIMCTYKVKRIRQDEKEEGALDALSARSTFTKATCGCSIPSMN